MLLLAAWIPFLEAGHSLHSEVHNPLALTHHIDLHHEKGEMDKDHSHPQDHEHEGHFTLPNVFVVLATLATFFFLLPSKFQFLSLFQKKSDPSISLDYHLSIHKTVVLLN